jgi:CRISPR-associated protein Csd2
MIFCGIYDFEHGGTPPEDNGEEIKREARLGCVHAHEIFEGIEGQLRARKDFPESFAG